MHLSIACRSSLSPRSNASFGARSVVFSCISFPFLLPTHTAKPALHISVYLKDDLPFGQDFLDHVSEYAMRIVIVTQQVQLFSRCDLIASQGLAHIVFCPLLIGFLCWHILAFQ